MSTNFFTDNDDLRFQLSQVDWDRLVDLTERLSKDDDALQSGEEGAEFFEQMLESLGEYVAHEIAPHRAELDEQHPELKDGEVKDPARMASIMKGLREMGAFGLSLPRNVGGMNAPLVLSCVFYEMLSRADVSVMSHFGFHAGIAQALSLYSLEEGSATIENERVTGTRWQDACEKMAAGEEWGAMVLTEPGAGSDLAQIRAKAVLGDDDIWRITGQKIFITSGHGHHHIVIARSEPDDTHPGLKGLSLFYVASHIEKDGKKVRNVEVGGLEHKMGQHSVVAATLNYDESEAELIGTRGHGFRGMLLLMNNARIAVGFEAIGVMETAYRQSSTFAEERISMGKPIAQHEMIADYLDEMDITIRGLRAMSFESAYQEEVATRIKTLLKVELPKDDAERRKREKEAALHKRKARRLTPLIKYLAGEESVRFARMNMQILGGIGYTVEYGAEKLLRDSLVIPVYEGTSQIQALMALKDNLQAVLRNPGKSFSMLTANKIEAVRAKDELDRDLAKLRGFANSAMQTILTRIAADKLGDLGGIPVLDWKKRVLSKWDPAVDFGFGLLHAERLCKLLTWEAIAEILVRQAHDVKGTEHEIERRDIASRWLDRFLPRAEGVIIEIEATNEGLLKRLFRRKRPKADLANDKDAA
ncbi:MAG: hypothetical protein GY822_02755 [Deltaproteobacteria bacterium]|nr:hypothetical protein [Deltaproteobacteria bacterium]